MGLLDTRNGRLAVILVGVLGFTLLTLVDVLGTLFFAVTIAYVLLPVKRRIVRGGSQTGSEPASRPSPHL